MWGAFILAVAVCVALLYLPGYVFWRAFRLQRSLAFCTAPIASVAALSVLAIAFQKLGIAANAVSLGSVMALAALACYALSRLARGKARELSFRAYETGGRRFSLPSGVEALLGRDHVMMLLYVACGAVVACFVFVANIGQADAFFSRWDNQTHVAAIRAFLDSDSWSSLYVDQYLATPRHMQPNIDFEPEFYPSAWHDVVAFVCSISGVSVPCSINAVNTALAGVVMPLSLFSFMRAAFWDKPLVVVAGIVAASACAIFPWWFFVTGPLYPNFAGMVLVPAVAGCAIAFLEEGMPGRKRVAFPVIFACCSVAALGLAHPNSLFYLYLVLGSFGLSFIPRAIEGSGRIASDRKTRVKAIALLLYCLCLAGGWAACLNAPFLQSAVGYTPDPKPGVFLAVANIVGMIGVEPLFALASAAGAVLCVRRRCAWVVLPALFLGLAYWFSRLDPGGIGRLLGGFWYTDSRRLGSCFGFSLVPLAACGLAWACSLALEFAQSRTSSSPGKPALSLAAVIVSFFVLNTFPSFHFEFNGETYGTGFGTFTNQVYQMYNPAVEHNYSQEEVEFVDEALGAIPEEGALVVNQPNDGSAFAYGVNGMNVYYRIGGIGGQTRESELIRSNLCDYADDPEVQEAVKQTGAQYVLLLDQGVAFEDGVWLSQYRHPQYWEGIEGVTDSTPGFSVVLARDDMRLYRIEDIGSEGQGAS